METRHFPSNNKQKQTDDLKLLGAASRLTNGPYGMIYEMPNPTPFRNP